VREGMKEIQKHLKKWQGRLGLSDWDITIKIRDAQDMNQNVATTRVRENMQHADIRLMDKGDRQQSDPGDSDPELDLVHELVHVRLWSIDPVNAEGALHTCREQAIEWIAKALISTDRGVK
jgi:hypothetical protein